MPGRIYRPVEEQRLDWLYQSKGPDIQFDKPRYRNLGINPVFVEEFQKANQMDYAIYQQAKEFIGYC